MDLDPVCDYTGPWGPLRSYPNECTAKCNGGVCLKLTITDHSDLIRASKMGAAASINLGQQVHAPINFKTSYFLDLCFTSILSFFLQTLSPFN